MMLLLVIIVGSVAGLFCVLLACAVGFGFYVTDKLEKQVDSLQKKQHTKGGDEWSENWGKLIFSGFFSYERRMAKF